jgi:pimeloyl-ACP methyl ester carboxylesterase
MRVWSLLAAVVIAVLAPSAGAAEPPSWQTLPPTPGLPTPLDEGMAPVDDIRLHYAVFGRGAPVILLHGGLANMNYWGHQVPALAAHYQVILVDSRGHGRSTRSTQAYSYELMATDVVGLMDHLKLRKAAVVGWSDGAIIGLELAIHHADRVAGLYAFAANYNPSGLREDLDRNATFNGFIERCRHEYPGLSATPDRYDDFLAAVTRMWATEPNLPPGALRGIALPVVIADGDHDEAIKRSQTEEMAELIPGAGLQILPNVSHFAMLQDPAQFNEAVLHFLDHGVYPGDRR